jgi:hypothetical protein
LSLGFSLMLREITEVKIVPINEERA